MDEFIYKVNGEVLSDFEKKKFNIFNEYLHRNSKQVKVIYRGENYDNLKRKLNLIDDNNYSKLNHYVFLIGEKGRVYRNEYKNKIKQRNKIYSINNIEESLFHKIFDKFNIIISKKYSKPEIEIFKSDNFEFSEYFKDKNNNKTDFINKLNSVHKTNEKLMIRDYYLSLLHKIGTIGFYTNSFFTSTSTSYDVAKGFAENSENSEKIIFISWVKYPINQIGISFNYLNSFKNKILQFGLPTYDKSFFPNQNEITIKGGLLPHYILGYVRLKDNIFEINPNFFLSTKNFKEIVKNGFDINQSNFQENLNKTDYSGFFSLNDNNEYSDNNN